MTIGFTGGGGVDWSSKSFTQSFGTVASHFSNTELDISGSGYVVSIWQHSDGVNKEEYGIEVDGGNIQHINILSREGAFGISLLPVRFDSSLKVSSSDGRGGVWVVQD